MKLPEAMFVVTLFAVLCWGAQSTLHHGADDFGVVLLIAVSAAWLVAALSFCGLMGWAVVRHTTQLMGTTLIYAFAVNFVTAMIVLTLPFWAEKLSPASENNPYPVFPPPLPWYSDLQAAAYIFVSTITLIWTVRSVIEQQDLGA